MQAKNGFGSFGIRRSWRLMGCVLALVALAAMAAVPSLASARTTKAAKVKPIRQTYLALGDSLAFGYSQQLFNENEHLGVPAAAFEHGYTNDYFNLINTSTKLQLVNDGCPGETSESLIGNNPALLSALNEKLAGKIATPVTGETPCAYHTALGLALHHEYGGTKSQLESAIETIAQEKAARKPVKIITFNIGANDELHVLKQVEKEATTKVEEKVTVTVRFEVFAHVQQIAKEEVNQFVVEQVAPQAAAETEGKEPAFAERIAVLAKEYGEAHAQELTELGKKDATEYGAAHAQELQELGVKLGKEYAAEHAAALKAEGEAIAKTLFNADVPALFQQIITNITGVVIGLRDGSAFGGINYSGKIVFQGGYDPFGNVFGTGEVNSGSNALAEQLNLAVQAAVTTPIRVKMRKFPALCYVNPHPSWNPGGAEEVAHLQAWTNMANLSESFGKKNGPDIHPTPVGYQQLANEMEAVCPF
jgi:lysophospholipase L1-like esterase